MDNLASGCFAVASVQEMRRAAAVCRGNWSSLRGDSNERQAENHLEDVFTIPVVHYFPIALSLHASVSIDAETDA